MVGSEQPVAARPTAPAPLDLVQAFVNTRAITADDPHAREDLSAPAALDAWWRAHNPGTEPLRADHQDLEIAIIVREGLRALLARNNDAGLAVDPDALDRFDQIAATLPLRIDRAPGALVAPIRTTPARTALAELLARSVQARADGTWTRLKACRDPHCREAFYDTSKNHSATWCSMAVCGARAKQRAFIDRRRQQSQQRPARQAGTQR